MTHRPVKRERLVVDDAEVEVIYKATRRMYLRVRASDGTIEISAPCRVKHQEIAAFVRSQREWIAHQRAIQALAAAKPPEPPDGAGEALHVWGHRLPIERRECGIPGVTLLRDRIVLSMPPGSTPLMCNIVITRWRREILRAALTPLVGQWSQRLGLPVPALRLTRMRTRWGSCSLRTGRVAINLDLTRYPSVCLEYIVVHELLHFHIQSHGPRFHRELETHLPHWREARRMLG